MRYSGMKKIFLYAYDRQNLGDDMFIHLITKRYSNVRFYMLSDKKNIKTYSCFPNLKIINKDSLIINVLNRIRHSFAARYKNWLEARCDATVYIGGSIFMEYPNWSDICNWWDYEVKNRKFYVLGANFGPWYHEAYKKRMASIFTNMSDVCFRDQYSKEVFKNVKNVRCAPDILFSYPLPKVKTKEKQIFVSVIDCAGRDESHGLKDFDSRYVDNMVSLLLKYVDNGYNLVLASFCKSEGDENGICKILSKLGHIPDSKIEILKYDGNNSNDIISAIVESALVIATRFHAMIFALAAKKPVLPIIYSDKMYHVLEDLGYKGAGIDIRDEDEWNMKNAQVIHLPDDISIQAEKHFYVLDQKFEKRVN